MAVALEKGASGRRREGARTEKQTWVVGGRLVGAESMVVYLIVDELSGKLVNVMAAFIGFGSSF